MPFARSWPTAPAVIALCLAAADAASAPGKIHPLEAITAAVHAHVAAEIEGQDAEFKVGRLDPRLRLAACTRALETRSARTPTGGGPTSVEVRCTGAKPWALYVPVAIARYAEVVVAARPVARGAVITAGDLATQRRRLAGARGDYLHSPTAAVGRVATRALRTGTVIGGNQLKAARLVQRGQAVVLARDGGGISVRVKGKALEDGTAGERIAVRNLSSDRVVEGVVRGDGVVVVGRAAVL